MANFNGFYQPMYPQNAYNVAQNAYNVPQNGYSQPQSNPSTADERIWVANEQAAESYLVAPNSFVRLWDSNVNRFYEKRADATGRPLPVECYEYKKIVPTQTTNNNNGTTDYQEQINALIGRVKALEEVIKNGNNGADESV